MSADNLRGIRIILLKYTHLPFVGIIMLYESMQERLNRLTRKDSVFVSIGMPSISQRTSKNQIRSFSARAEGTDSSQHILDQQEDAEILSPAFAQSIATLGNAKLRSQARGEENASMQQKMDELNEKIERLTALVLAQQHKASETQEDTE